MASCCGFAKQCEAKHAPADGPEPLCIYHTRNRGGANSLFISLYRTRAQFYADGPESLRKDAVCDIVKVHC